MPGGYAKRLGDSSTNEGGIGYEGKLYEVHAVGKVLHNFRAHLQAQARFARATRACHADYAVVGIAEELARIGHFLLPANEGRDLHGQIVGSNAKGLKGREFIG